MTRSSSARSSLARVVLISLLSISPVSINAQANGSTDPLDCVNPTFKTALLGVTINTDGSGMPADLGQLAPDGLRLIGSLNTDQYDRLVFTTHLNQADAALSVANALSSAGWYQAPGQKPANAPFCHADFRTLRVSQRQEYITLALAPNRPATCANAMYDYRTDRLDAFDITPTLIAPEVATKVEGGKRRLTPQLAMNELHFAANLSLSEVAHQLNLQLERLEWTSGDDWASPGAVGSTWHVSLESGLIITGSMEVRQAPGPTDGDRAIQYTYSAVLIVSALLR